MNEYATATARRTLPPKLHVIGDDISYTRDHVSCACGWVGKAAGGIDYLEHRKAVGERPLTLSTSYGSGRK